MKHLTLLIGIALVLGTQSPLAQQSNPVAARDLVGTWMLIVLEHGTSGAQATPVANPRGLLILDRAGHAFEFVTSSTAQRAPVGAQAPLADAPATFAGYGGFWGGYRFDPAQNKIVLRPESGISTLMTPGREFSRSIEYSGDRLT